MVLDSKVMRPPRFRELGCKLSEYFPCLSRNAKERLPPHASQSGQSFPFLTCISHQADPQPNLRQIDR